MTDWRRGRATLKAGALYFALTFAAGFALAPLRLLWLAPLIGHRAAELAEAPVMLGVMVLAARWALARFAHPAPNRAVMGLVGVTLMLVAEFGLVLPLRGMSIAEYVATRDPVAGTVYHLSLGLFAVMPLLVRRR